LWSWPGSGKKSGTFDVSGFFGADETNMNIGDTVYIDKDGREWSYMSYFYGYRDIWVCISDPSNTDIPAFNLAPELDLFPAVEPGAVSKRPSTPMLAISLVSLTVMLSVVLIFVFWNKKAGKNKGQQ